MKISAEVEADNLIGAMADCLNKLSDCEKEDMKDLLLECNDALDDIADALTKYALMADDIQERMYQAFEEVISEYID